MTVECLLQIPVDPTRVKQLVNWGGDVPGVRADGSEGLRVMERTRTQVTRDTDIGISCFLNRYLIRNKV